MSWGLPAMAGLLAPVAADPQQPPFANVVYLFQFQGGISDVKGNSFTGGSGLSISTAAHKWGSDSCRFPGPNGSGNPTRALVPTLAGSGPGTGDFTFECWFNVDSLGPARQNIMSIGGNSGIGVWVGSSGRLVVATGGGTGGGDILLGSSTIAGASWNFMRGSRQSGVFYLGLNGSTEGSVGFTDNLTLNASYIGAYNSNYASLFVGYMQDARYTKGWGGPTNEIPIAPFPTS